ncbi:MAG TPA: DUF3500 domain-containing protein [Thermoanaerobaculia bacterium]|nr:DUF3500 domain-containing protein [Thermoanaerobaculia bacterium]
MRQTRVALLGLIAILPMPTAAADSTLEAMVEAARVFLASLDPEQREGVAQPFEGEARFRFHYVPSFERAGLPLEALAPHQVHLAHVLLSASLSRTGYAKTVNVMALETVLGRLEAAAGRPGALDLRDPSRYFVAVWGEPGSHAWGWRIEGHHVSLHFTLVDGEAVATAPAFLGANPHRVPEGPHEGLRVLGAEEDRARALLRSLDEGQRSVAVVADEAPSDIFTTNQPRVTPGEPAGIAASALTEEQRGLLRDLLEAYIGNLPEDLATLRRARLEEAVGALHFAWLGSLQPREPHYYRIQGPSFVVEYDNVQNGANHSHTVWRDFDGDFGRDLLAEHHRRHRH